MGQYGLYDLYVTPFVRDFSVFFPMLLVWFAIQWVTKRVLTSYLGSSFTRLPQDERNGIVVRVVSICNGLLMTGGALCFLKDLHAHGYTFHNDQYREIPGYRFFRISIVSYFAWDIIVCYMYKWELPWKVHAIVSFIGAYQLSFPFSDHYGSYFTGMFELSNAPLHFSVIARMLDIAELAPVATVMEVLFALLFVVVRVVGGTYVAWSWLQHTCLNLLTSYHVGGTLVHGELPLIVSMVLLIVVQSLQYFWFIEVLKNVGKALGSFKQGRLKAKQV